MLINILFIQGKNTLYVWEMTTGSYIINMTDSKVADRIYKRLRCKRRCKMIFFNSSYTKIAAFYKREFYF